MLNEVEMLELSWQIVEGIKRLRKVGKQEWLCYVRPQNIPVDFVLWEGSEDTPFMRPSGKQ